MFHQSLSNYKSVKLTDNFLCYIWQGMGNNCNTCFLPNVLQGEHPHVIIDPGSVTNELNEPCFSQLTKSIETDGFKVEDIGLIINTHSHIDHCGANESIVAKSNANITISQKEDEFRKTLGKRIDSMFGTKTPEFTPLFFLKEGTLNLGTQNQVDFQVIHTPGHSPGSICLYWLEQKILITGDVVFYGSVGRTDFPGGSISELKQSIDKLSRLDVECLIPGHSTELGNIIKGKRNIERNFQAIKLFV